MKNLTNSTPARHGLSLVIPTVAHYTMCRLPQDFLQSGLVERFDLQFVFMQNSKRQQSITEQCEINGIETIVVGNDRYFGSCEENIFRVRDLGRILRPWVLIVGEHDRIDWEVLCGAVDFAILNQLEILGLNVLSCQLRVDGSESQLQAVPALEGNSTANILARQLLAGEVLNGNLALPALLSNYGPIDWSAFIGNHLYSREVLFRVLQYRFVEHVYSFPYMQLQYLAESRIRYAFYSETPIHRISSEHKNMRNGDFSWGWLVEHRLVQGASAQFWVANLAHLNQLENEMLFLLVANGRNVSHVAGLEENIVFQQNFMLQASLCWSHAVLVAMVIGHSNYLDSNASGANLMDARYVLSFLVRLVRALERPQILEAHGGVAMLCVALRPIVSLLRSYLIEARVSEQLCILAADKLAQIIKMLSPEMQLALNQVSFNAYLAQLEN